MLQEGILQNKKVSDIMTPNPVTCTPEDSLQKIAEKMRENDCGAIPLVDEKEKPLGIITDRDITIRCVAEGRNSQEMKAGDCMTEQIHTIEENKDLDEAMQKMEANQIRRILVVDNDGKCCGIIAQADIALADRDEAGEMVEEVSQPSH